VVAVKNINPRRLTGYVLRDVDIFAGFGVVLERTQIIDEARTAVGVAFINAEPIGGIAPKNKVEARRYMRRWSNERVDV
jgi:hypothetical protein